MNSVRSLQNWFKTHLADNGAAYTLDKNQARIVLDQHKNTLVTARAGSGKTRTIVAKVAYLLTHEQIPPAEIIVFAFNRKARAEINERLTKITFDGKPLFTKTPTIATTFHAFAYKILGGKKVLASKMIDETTDYRLLRIAYQDARQAPQNQDTQQDPLNPKLLEIAKQFITRAEQQFFSDYHALISRINHLPDTKTKSYLKLLYQILVNYKSQLKTKQLTNFNEIMAAAAKKVNDISQANTQSSSTPNSTHAQSDSSLHFSYIFVDEYQDFSKLFLNLIQALRAQSPEAHLLAVGDDWQAINRFAGSNVDYFLNFQNYFPEDCAKLFIPTNYRSGKKIVENANFFMSKALGDFRGCKSGNKLHAKIFYKNMLFENYHRTILQIIQQNPKKSIKILARNNELGFERRSLTNFVAKLQATINPKLEIELSESTIHRSKGLESDIVILLEIDGGKFPGPDKTGGLYEIFGDTPQNLFLDEARLFYVALTRPKEKLYILSKTPHPRKENKKYNFFSYLNDEWLEEI